MLVAGGEAIQLHPEANGRPPLRQPQHHVEAAAVEPDRGGRTGL
jgi:hypothetical protein